MKFYPLSLAALLLCACVSTPPNEPADPPGSPIVYETNPEPVPPIIVAQPDPSPQPIPTELPPPPPPPDLPPIIEIYEDVSLFDALPHWDNADHLPALSAFKKTCRSWDKADPYDALNPKLPEYGNYLDWAAACQVAEATPQGSFNARTFFETEFAPVNLSLQAGNEGLLTGYYEPEVSVRRVPDAVYSEPILAKPTREVVMSWPRSKISPSASRVIAYGKPIDVFFMQVQGSGRIKFPDGRTLRAAYNGNNGHKYTSIGRVLVERGELTLEKASKQSIEDWMQRNGAAKTRELMNQNKRYIFFAEQAISGNEGPQGAMRVPLTSMGSLAVDSRYHPYGTLVWLDTKIPSRPGDYRGVETGLLVSAQDTGSAIKGPLRGDLFFGPGDGAGALAGVMKHPVKWTILLPIALAMKQAPVS